MLGVLIFDTLPGLIIGVADSLLLLLYRASRPLVAVLGEIPGSGALLAAANPKNLLLAVGGAAVIAQTGIAGAQQAIAYAVFAVIATIGVGAPVAIYFAMGKRSQDLLGRLKDWMGQHNAVIMSVLCLIIGVKLIGDAISALT